MKVLLINPRCRENAPPAVFPIGMGLIAAKMAAANHDVEVYDADGYRHPDSEIEDKIRKTDFDALAVGGMITIYQNIRKICAFSKKYHPKKKVIVGGSLATTIPEVVLRNIAADILVIGEGERTVVELLAALQAGQNLSSVAGLYYRDGDRICKTAPRDPIHDLSEIGFPAWDRFAIENYAKSGFHTAESFRLKSMNISTVRGCPFPCTYCYRIFGRTVRKRPVKLIVDEIEILKNRYDIGYFGLLDDLFTIKKAHVKDFCDELHRRRLKIKWSTSARCNTVDREMLEMMRDAGCVYLGYGIESGSQRILDYYQRKNTVEQAFEALRLTKEVGIRPHGSLMIGAPIETEEDIMMSAEFARKAGIFLQMGFVTPFPGTPLYDYARSKGLIKDEAEYAARLGDTTRLLVNLTRYSDEELIGLKDKAERYANRLYVLRNIANIPDIAYRHYKMWGLRSLLKEFARLWN